MTNEELAAFARSLLAENTALRIELRDISDKSTHHCIQVLEGMHEAYGPDEAPDGWHEAIDHCIVAMQTLLT